ncbi:MAG: VCBS repeat-containing protein [Planctomycetes bacterium]|nr:VCBS repeat-containing protein [Planctomycetota bacterium]
MTKKRRLLLLWTAFSVVVLGGGAWFSVRALAPAPPPPDEGLVPGLTDDLAARVPARAPALRFERLDVGFRHFPGERTHRLPEDMGPGVAVADLDGDGAEDLFFVQSGPLGTTPPPCELWRGDGRGGFARVDTPMPALHGLGVALGDVEGDGDLDLYVTGFGRNALLRNEGTLHFSDVTDEAGVAGGGFCTAATFGDADGDGDLDLYVCRYVEHDPGVSTEASRRGSMSLPASLNPSAFRPATNLLYLREPDGRYREAARDLGVDNPTGRSLGAVFADFDGDGVLDLYVANDVSDNAMYRGRRGQPFQDVTHPSCTADPLGAMGIAVGDPDLDGDLDVFVTHWQTEENLLLEKTDAGFVFADASLRTYLGPPGRGRVGWATDFADLDDDGHPDVLVANGSTFEQPDDRARLQPQPPGVYWNAGGRFFDLVGRAGPDAGAPVVARGGVAADLDRDGRVDWVVAVHGGAPRVWRNVTEPVGHHLVVEPRGRGANPFAYGALVTVEAGGRRQAQAVGTKVSYASAGPPALHFGLGAEGRATRVVVRFPSGTVVERRDVAAGQRLVVADRDDRAVGARLDAAGDAIAAGRLDDARASLRAVLEEDPRHPGALYRLAMLSPPQEALVLADRLAVVEPTSARAPLLRTRVLSDPWRPDLLDLDAARRALDRAHAINPNETGVILEEGRMQLLLGDVAGAAATFEKGIGNPRAMALAALCRLRLGDGAKAARLLGRSPGQGPPHADEGDTAAKKLGSRDTVAKLLDLGRDDARWALTRLDLVGGGGRGVSFDDLDGDGARDAVVGDAAVRLVGREPRGPLPVPEGRRPAARPMTGAPYDLDAAAVVALAPPSLLSGDPLGTTAVVEVDADRDGDLDRVVGCAADDPCAPLPWWLLLREGDRFRAVRGSLPVPGFRVAAVAAADLDGDGRVEVLLSGGGAMPGDTGEVWLASWLGEPTAK